MIELNIRISYGYSPLYSSSSVRVAEDFTVLTVNTHIAIAMDMAVDVFIPEDYMRRRRYTTKFPVPLPNKVVGLEGAAVDRHHHHVGTKPNKIGRDFSLDFVLACFTP
ncbi:hypothetical protein SUGI_0919540 [Cryptomeria japonica]|nr:hypothetical protein SUGI_0919540 [Cryptomeria japonica]